MQNTPYIKIAWEDQRLKQSFISHKALLGVNSACCIKQWYIFQLSIALGLTCIIFMTRVEAN